MWKDEGYLPDILIEARKLVTRFTDVSREDFYTNEEKQYSVFWSITVMVEAAGKNISGIPCVSSRDPLAGDDRHQEHTCT